MELYLQILGAEILLVASDCNNLSFRPHLNAILYIAFEDINFALKTEGEPPLALIFIHIGDSGITSHRLGLRAGAC